MIDQNILDGLNGGSICMACGHSLADHATSLHRGKLKEAHLGGCLKELIKDWDYCNCHKFVQNPNPPAKITTTGEKPWQRKHSR